MTLFAGPRLFAGLGNPGPKHAGNRHNIGFMALDRIAADHGFAPWRRAHQGMVTEGHLGAVKVILLKPETFMNLSGQSLRAAVDFYKIDLSDIVVFHDELDLAPGKMRLKQAGGHAGHNGLRSIHAHLGEGYGRVRLGIGHPGHKDAVAAYVLHDFAKADRDWLDALLQGLSEAAPALASGDEARFMNLVALRTTPPRPSTGTEGTRSSGKGGAASAAPMTTKPATSQPKVLPPLAPAEGATAAADSAALTPLQKLMQRFK